MYPPDHEHFGHRPSVIGALLFSAGGDGGYPGNACANAEVRHAGARERGVRSRPIQNHARVDDVHHADARAYDPSTHGYARARVIPSDAARFPRPSRRPRPKTPAPAIRPA